VAASATTDAATGESDDDGGGDGGGGRALAILVLLTVPLAWGTYTPAVKYMYDRVDPPMPGFVFSAGYYLVAAMTLGALSSHFSSEDDDGGGSSRRHGDDTSRSGDGRDDERGGSGGGRINDDEGTTTARGGWELGSYLFVGNGLQVVGLQTVPADRAGEEWEEKRRRFAPHIFRCRDFGLPV
jgi:hypothetical protein